MLLHMSEEQKWKSGITTYINKNNHQYVKTKNKTKGKNNKCENK